MNKLKTLLSNNIKPVAVVLATAACAGAVVKWQSMMVTVISSSAYSVPYTAAGSVACFLIALLIDKLIDDRLSAFNKTLVAASVQGLVFYACVLMNILPLVISPVAAVVTGFGYILYKCYEENQKLQKNIQDEEQKNNELNKEIEKLQIPHLIKLQESSKIELELLINQLNKNIELLLKNGNVNAKEINLKRLTTLNLALQQIFSHKKQKELLVTALKEIKKVTGGHREQDDMINVIERIIENLKIF